jgi:hypothetical protein
MNSNQREHSYGDLREVVIEIMLDDSEHGANNLERVLEKTALELCRRDGLAARRQHFSRGAASQLHPSDSELVLEIVWDLARQGILTFGVNASNPSSPCLRPSRFSEYALRHGAHPFHNNTGFMKALRWEAADISPDAVVYLREAVSAFYMDCLLSTCVMLSVAAEGEFLRLLNVAKNSKPYGRYFSRIGDGLNVAVKISQFREAIKPILTLFPKSATDELDHNLDTVQTVIRTARNQSGQPSGALPPTRDQVYLYLQDFIPFARQAMLLRQELNEAPYPRLVQVH